MFVLYSLLLIIFASSNLVNMVKSFFVSSELVTPWLFISHHGPAVSRFLVSNGSTNRAGCLRWLLRLIKTHFENISGCPF